MVTDQQVKLLLRLLGEEPRRAIAAVKSGMDEKTARKYRRAGRLPSEMKNDHTWRTREDLFTGVWEALRAMLEVNPGLEAKTLFAYLQREYPGRFQDGQLRTLQRRVKTWRALWGPGKEVFFPQEHYPGRLCQSDFTDMRRLEVSIQRVPFEHLVYHFVLTYSNWEAGTVCFSESFESLSEGLQNALWELGGVPGKHQADCLSAAVNNLGDQAAFTERYQALLRHYGIEGARIQPDQPHENGDIEQRHHRFKRAVEQALMLRGSRDFASRQEYEEFLRGIFAQLNAGRRERLREELAALQELPDGHLEACKRLRLRVGPSCLISVQHNTYSVHSRLRGETVEVRLYADRLEVWYGQKCLETMPRQRGEGKRCINYRHLIDCLVRKPGAFENFKYRDALFPSSRFRMAYDALTARLPARAASKEYVGILALAAGEGESRVDDALRWLLELEAEITREAVRAVVMSGRRIPLPTEVSVAAADLADYDRLLAVGKD